MQQFIPAGLHNMNIMQQLHSGTYGKEGDVLDYILYDEFQIDGTTPTLIHRLFSNPIGGAGGRNYSETNMESNQGLPQGQKFTAHAIQIIYTAEEARVESEIQLFQEMLHNTHLNFFITGKDTYYRVTLDTLMGAPVEMSSVAANAGYTPSYGTYQGIIPLNIPIVLASQIRFEVVVTHEVAPSSDLDDDWVRICLPGILERRS